MRLFSYWQRSHAVLTIWPHSWFSPRLRLAPRAQTVAKLEEEKTELAGLVPVLRVLEGDEERSYWLQLLESKKQLKKKGHGHGNKQQGGGSKRGVKRDAEDDEESEEPAEKVAKTEA